MNSKYDAGWEAAAKQAEARRDAVIDERDALREINVELVAALKGTLYLFEQHAVSVTDAEQIFFARSVLAKARKGAA